MVDSSTDAFARELRIAPVMTGGTSLAVWMGGVTAELYRVLMATREPTNADLRIYRRLLELTATTPRVDVITGTSAGGLNGAVLASGWHLELPVDRFMAMREIWLDIGDINQLLRSPNEADPPSLLQGDDYFAPKLRDTLDGWAASGSGTRAAEDRPIDLLINVTTVSGEPRTRYDSFDQPIGEQRYDHALNFVRASDRSDEVHDRDDFRDRRWIDQLATAARTSASIPFVFEPSYLRVQPDAVDPPVAGRPNFAGHASFSVSRWAIDGGVLNNLPLGAAIDRIFVQRADREVRRVVLYVMPTPSLPPVAVADDGADMPRLASVIAGAAAATWAQGVATDIDRLQEHNVRASRQRAGRVARFKNIDPSALFAETRKVWAQYVQLRTLTSVSRMLDTAGRELTDPLRADQVDVEAALRTARQNVLPAPPPPDGTLALGNAEGDRPWGWGISSLEQAIAVGLGIIGDTLALPRPPLSGGSGYAEGNEEHRRELGRARDRLYSVLTRLHAARALDSAYWATEVHGLADRLRAVEPGSAGDRSGRTPAQVTATWAEHAYAQWPFVLDRDGMLAKPQPAAIAAAVARIDALEAGEAGEPSGVFGSAQGAGNASTIALLRWVAALGTSIAELLRIVDVHARAVARAATRELTPAVVDEWFSLASIVAWLDDTRPGTPGVTDDDALAPEQEEIVDRLRNIVSQLDLLVPAGSTVDDVLLRLLAMHVLDTAYETRITTNEQVLELLQVSWNAPNELDDRRPSAKLTGTEAGRLGAFLKRSWRANDWMWGRLDGAHRLLTVLVDPARLRQLRLRPDTVAAALRAIVIDVDEDPDRPFTSVWDANAGVIAEELAFLDPTSRLATPKSLPRTVKVLAYALQTEICQQELPVLHDAMQVSRDAGGHEGDGGAFRSLYERTTSATNGTVRARDVPTLLRAARVGDESAAGEIGHDMLTRTAGQAAAVSVKVLTGQRGQVPLVSRVARPLRAPTMVLYGLTRAMTTDSHVARFALALALAVSGALLGVRMANDEAVNGTVAGIAALVFLVALGVALLRSRAWTGLPALALLGVIGLALAGGAGMVDILYDLPSDAPTWKRLGFVDPWSVVLVVLMLVTVASVIGFGRELARRWSTAAPTDLRAEEWAAIDRAGYYRLLRRGTLIVVLLPAAMLTVQWVFEQVMLGRPPVLDRAGAIVEAGAGAVKDWIIDAATWLQDRDVILLAVALAVFGAVIGLGYDKLVASWVNPGARRVRRSIARLGHRGTAEPGLAAAEAAGGSDGSATPLPHPWSRLTAAQRWVLFVSTGVATAALSYALWALPVPDGGIVELELARYPDALAWRGSTATTWSLILDYPYLVAYGVFLSLALAFFASVWNTRARHEHHASGPTTVTDWASRAAWLPLAAAAADSIENAFLLGFLGGRPGWTADAGAAFATLKFFLLGAAALALLAQAAVWAALLVRAEWRKRHVVS